MSDYAVVNPATGETLATYPTTTDAELETASPPRRRMPPTARGATSPSPSARRSSAASPSCTASAATSSPRSSCARWASRSPRRVGEVDFAADITEYYADNAEKIMGDQPIDILGEGTAVIRRVAARRAARDHAVELPVLPGRPLRGAEPRDRQHDPAQARLAVPRVRGRDRDDLPRRRLPRRRVHQPLRDQRAGRRR